MNCVGYSVVVKPITKMPISSGRVYLSFDDGPDIEWTPRFLDLLAANGVHVTFFIVGCRAQAVPQLVRRAVAEGHAIGNHSFSHRHPWMLSARAARAEVRDGAAAIADVTGHMPQLFRPPHGRMHRAMLEESSTSGQAIILWNRSAIDWGPLGTSNRIAARLAKTQPGDIILMHDAVSTNNKPHELIPILPVFLNNLAAQSLKCVALNASCTVNCA